MFWKVLRPKKVPQRFACKTVNSDLPLPHSLLLLSLSPPIPPSPSLLSPLSDSVSIWRSQSTAFRINSTFLWRCWWMAKGRQQKCGSHTLQGGKGQSITLFVEDTCTHTLAMLVLMEALCLDMEFLFPWLKCTCGIYTCSACHQKRQQLCSVTWQFVRERRWHLYRHGYCL